WGTSLISQELLIAGTTAAFISLPPDEIRFAPLGPVYDLVSPIVDTQAEVGDQLEGGRQTAKKGEPWLIQLHKRADAASTSLLLITGTAASSGVQPQTAGVLECLHQRLTKGYASSDLQQRTANAELL